MKPVLLIDGDQFLYKACIACETEIRWDEENHVLYANREEAWELMQGSIRKVQEALGVQTVRLAFTVGESFRKGLYEPYKASRAGVRKPLCFAEVRELAEAKWPSYKYPGLEADDVLGIWATRGGIDPTIVSDDKDLKTIPGKLYRQGTLETIEPFDALRFWMYQTLVGDTADGYPGCPGIGAVKAEKLLGDRDNIPFNPWWNTVVAAYEKAGLTADDALLQARLARILHASDWDAKKKEVILWTPNK
jgi:DNA polymerase-1